MKQRVFSWKFSAYRAATGYPPRKGDSTALYLASQILDYPACLYPLRRDVSFEASVLRPLHRQYSSVSHVRPIVRGKANKVAEFGAKLSVSQTASGIASVDHNGWDTFREGSVFSTS